MYALLLAALDLDVPADERGKPSCCDTEGLPPADAELATEIADAVTRIGRNRR